MTYTDPHEPIYTVKQAAVIYGIKRSTILSAIRRGAFETMISANGKGGHGFNYGIPQHAIEEWINNKDAHIRGRKKCDVPPIIEQHYLGEKTPNTKEKIRIEDILSDKPQTLDEVMAKIDSFNKENDDYKRGYFQGKADAINAITIKFNELLKEWVQ